MPGIVSDVAAGQTSLFVPCLFFGSSMYLEFTGLVVIGTGVGQGDAVARARTESVARRLKAVADPTRLAILHSLATAPSTVGELAVLFRLAQPTVSMHVKVLRQSGLVRSERQAGRLRLSADPAAVEALLGELRQAVLPGRAAPDWRSLRPPGDSTTGSDRMPATVVDEHTLGRARHRVVGVARQQLLHEDPRLEPGQAGPEADVLAEPEGEVHRVDRSPDVEDRRVLPEDPLVSVGRGVEHAEVVALAHRRPGDDHVLAGGAAERVHRRDPAQALLHRAGNERGVRGQRGALVGVLVRARAPSPTGACASSRCRRRAGSGGT